MLARFGEQLLDNVEGFDEVRVLEVAEVAESPQGTTYEVDLEKGEHSMEVVFAADGKVLKSVVEEEDEKDEGPDEKD